MTPGTPRVFFGWWVAGAFAVMVFVSTRIRFAVGPFLKPVVADLGIDRASFSLVISLSLFLFELTGGYGVAFAVASAQLVVAAFVSLAIDERSRCWVPSPAVARAG